MQIWFQIRIQSFFFLVKFKNKIIIFLFQVDLEVGPSLVFLHGTLIRHFMHVKENLFGEDQKYTPMDEQWEEEEEVVVEGERRPEERKREELGDLRQYRPLNVVLDITLHDVQVTVIFPFQREKYFFLLSNFIYWHFQFR